jgi:hypothetical protein
MTAASGPATIGRLRAAVFNAVSADRAASLELSVAQFESAWRISTLGGFIFGREALRALLASGGGSLLFTGATASLRGRPPFGAFAAAKAGLRSSARRSRESLARAASTSPTSSSTAASMASACAPTPPSVRKKRAPTACSGSPACPKMGR